MSGFEWFLKTIRTGCSKHGEEASFEAHTFQRKLSPVSRFTASSSSGYRFCKLNSSTTTCLCMRIIAVRRDYSQTFISMLCRAIYQLLAFFALGSGHKWSLTVKIRERKLGWLE